MVERSLDEWNLSELDCLFIENVGNLVCPSSYDLGENLRIVLMSVTEGEDKPLKYPTIFNTADVALITKMDLAEAVEFDLTTAHNSLQSVRPGMQVLELSAKTGEGLMEYSRLSGSADGKQSCGRKYLRRVRSPCSEIFHFPFGICQLVISKLGKCDDTSKMRIGSWK